MELNDKYESKPDRLASPKFIGTEWEHQSIGPVLSYLNIGK